MAEARSFFGGEAPMGQGAGEISAGKYTGADVYNPATPWKCPACLGENSGRLDLGCTACGAGKPGVHVGLAPPAAQPVASVGFSGFTPAHVVGQNVGYAPAVAWAEAHPDATLADAFAAGYQLATALMLRAAPRVTTDVEQLAPEGKARRTIIAALEIFTDQILTQDPDEIATGEWCSVAETQALIASLQSETEG